MMLQNASHWSETSAGTDSGATATHAAATKVAHFVTHISGHTDTDSVITIEDGSTVVWESKIDISLQGFMFGFDVGIIPITPGVACSVKIATSTSDCQVNGSGFSIP